MNEKKTAIRIHVEPNRFFVQELHQNKTVNCYARKHCVSVETVYDIRMDNVPWETIEKQGLQKETVEELKRFKEVLDKKQKNEN